MKSALLIGGTGPTGPTIAHQLAQRGYEVTILHRGSHEHPAVQCYEHIHADPHFLETLTAGLAGRSFDLAVASYGRLRVTAQALAGRTERLIGIGGFAGFRGFDHPEALFPRGMAVPTPETAEKVESEDEHRFASLITAAEREVLRIHPTASILRYPVIYGPNQLVPREWSIVRRILDRRPVLVLLDGGMGIMTACYSENAAHAVLLAVDNPQASAGQIYNVGDDTQFTYRQLAEIVADEMDYEWDVVALPDVPAVRKIAFNPMLRGTIPDHRIVDTFKIRHELGYRDAVHPVEAVRRTVRWLVENPIERGGSIEKRMLDAFDYAGEDALVALWAEIWPRFDALGAGHERPYFHAYAHPRLAGQAADHNQR